MMDSQSDWTQRIQNAVTLRYVNRALFIVALLILAGLFAVYVVFAIDLIQFPFDYDQGEGFELMDTVMFSRGEWPYQNTDNYPFYSSNYPPLFHVIAAPFVWLFGPAYWYGRLLGFLGTLVTAGVIGYVVYNNGGKHKWIAVLSGLAFLASNTVYHIGPLFRQHMTMVMFETLGIVILSRAFPQKQRRLIGLGLLLIIAAGYTKQLAAITAIAALAWMFLRNPRRSIAWGFIFATVGGTIFAWMVLATNDEWWRQVIVANVNDFDPEQMVVFFWLWFKLHGFLIVPAVLYVLYEFYFDRISLYSVWFLLAAVLGGIGAGTWGAGDSYYATAIAAMCILSGLFASRTLNRAWQFRDNYISRFFRKIPVRMPYMVFSRVIILVAVPLLYIGYGCATFHMPTEGAVFEQIADVFDIEPNVFGVFYNTATDITLDYAHVGHLVTQTDTDAGYEIVALIEETDSPVISEDAGFSFVAGREVVTNPTQLLNLWRAGMFDGSELINMVENQEFGLIVLRAQFYPHPVLIAITQAYGQVDTIEMNGFGYIIMRPRPDWSTDSGD